MGSASDESIAMLAARLKDGAMLSAELDAILSELREQERYGDMLTLYRRLAQQGGCELSPLAGGYLLDACAGAKDARMAWAIMEPHLSEPSWQDNVERLLRALEQAKRLDVMEQALDAAHKGGLPWVGSAFRLVLRRTMREHFADKAIALFLKAAEYGVQPDVGMYAIAIAACARISRGGQAIFFLHQASREGVELDLSVLAKAGAACRSQRDQPALQEVVRRVKGLARRGSIMTRSIVEEALREPGEPMRGPSSPLIMQPMLSRLEGEQAADLLYDMAVLGQKLDAGVYNAVHMPGRALELFSLLPVPERTAYDYGEAFRSLTQQQGRGAKVTVRGLLLEMIERGVPMDSVAVRLAFDALKEHVPPPTQELGLLLGHLRGQGQLPCMRGALVAIQGLARAGMMSEAWGLLDDVYLRKGLSRLPIGDYFRTLTACLVLGAWPIGCWLYDQARWQGVATDLHLQFVVHCLHDADKIEVIGRPIFQQALRDGVVKTLGSKRVRELDLHRLSVRMAQLAISETVEQLRREWVSEGRPDRVNNLYISPGRGSGGLRTGVLDYLYRCGLITRTDYHKHRSGDVEQHRLGSIPIYGAKLRSIWRKMSGPFPVFLEDRDKGKQDESGLLE